MYVRNDAFKMVIQYNIHQETEMSGTSLPDYRWGTSTFGLQARMKKILGHWQKSR